MTLKGKTFKDTKEGKEEAAFLKGRKETPRKEKGGMRNLLREAELEEREELLADLFEPVSMPPEEEDLAS